MKITIPEPRPIPKGRGVNSTGGKQGTIIRSRALKREKKLIQDAADKLDVTESEFIRWVSIHAAEEVMNGKG